MNNCFFFKSCDEEAISVRIKQLNTGKVGFYSIGLYPASLAYNCALQSSQHNLLLAPRPGRDLLGAFDKDSIEAMDENVITKIKEMGSHLEDGEIVLNTLSHLLLKCELVILSSNSSHIEKDLIEAINLRDLLNRHEVVLGCLVGSFSHSTISNSSYLLCEKETQLAFFSGFHRHGALRNPLDSFTANFCHPSGLTALFGARLLDKLSPNIQVSAGVHNLEGQYIKAAKNISSIFAGFAHTYHQQNPGLLPTILTLLLDQCLDQAATVSMSRADRDKLYLAQAFPLTELGYGGQRVEATFLRDNDREQLRDHTFSQLTAMVADVSGSMMQPQTGKPTRNFQAGQILAVQMSRFRRCPNNIDELILWCEDKGLKKGGLEGLTSLKYWPQILDTYSIPHHDASMINLLYLCVFADNSLKEIVYTVLTNSRELTNYCQESVRPPDGRRLSQLLDYVDDSNIQKFIVQSINKGKLDIKLADNLIQAKKLSEMTKDYPDYIKVLNYVNNI